MQSLLLLPYPTAVVIAQVQLKQVLHRHKTVETLVTDPGRGGVRKRDGLDAAAVCNGRLEQVVAERAAVRAGELREGALLLIRSTGEAPEGQYGVWVRHVRGVGVRVQEDSQSVARDAGLTHVQ